MGAEIRGEVRKFRRLLAIYFYLKKLFNYLKLGVFIVSLKRLAWHSLTAEVGLELGTVTPSLPSECQDYRPMTRPFYHNFRKKVDVTRQRDGSICLFLRLENW